MYRITWNYFEFLSLTSLLVVLVLLVVVALSMMCLTLLDSLITSFLTSSADFGAVSKNDCKPLNTLWMTVPFTNVLISRSPSDSRCCFFSRILFCNSYIKIIKFSWPFIFKNVSPWIFIESHIHTGKRFEIIMKYKGTILYVYERISESSNFFSHSKLLSLMRSYTRTVVTVEDTTPTKKELQTIST